MFGIRDHQLSRDEGDNVEENCKRQLKYTKAVLPRASAGGHPQRSRLIIAVIV